MAETAVGKYGGALWPSWPTTPGVRVGGQSHSKMCDKRVCGGVKGVTQQTHWHQGRNDLERQGAKQNGGGGVVQHHAGGKAQDDKCKKACIQLERTKWSERLPRGHDEEACHGASQRRREIIGLMRSLVGKSADSPVCPEWDTSETANNTPGPYRFGVVKPSLNNDNHKIIGSKMTINGCECIKRNGLQDDCRLPRCRGSPACKITPFPKCEPFLGIPAPSSGSGPGHASGYQTIGGPCKCPPSAAPAAVNYTPQGLPTDPSLGLHCECVCL